MKPFRLLISALLLLLFALTLPAQQSTPVSGRDYMVITGGAPFAPQPGKLEVAEVFSYRCTHCNDFAPLLADWKRSLPANVNVVHVPAVFMANDPFAQAYYAAQKLGIDTRAHAALFHAVHVEHSIPMRPDARTLANFYSRYGVSAEQFLAAMNSPSVAAQMERAHQFAVNSQIQGTPTLIVNGIYQVRGRSHQDNLRIARALLNQSQPAR